MLLYKFAKQTDISEQELSEINFLLSSEQQIYIASLGEKRRKQSLCARTLLSAVLSDNFEDLSISLLETDNKGKPHLKDSNLYISLTHSGEYVGCAISDSPVGIDIEEIKPVKYSVVNRVCSLDEQQFVKNNGEASFFTVWTLKEAFIKANGFNTAKISEIFTVKDGLINLFPDEFIMGEIQNYKWSIIRKQR